MKLRPYITYLLTTTILAQSCLPAFAVWDDITEVEKHAEIIQHGSIPAQLNFKALLNHTAGGCLFYARHGDAIKVLLGHRDDEDTFCNPGGKSDSADETVAITSAREAAEETLNIYCPHPEFLKTQPFVDLYSLRDEKPFLNRMYFVEQQYVDEAFFNDRLKNAVNLKLSHHQQEYRSFKWVPVEDLLKAAQEGVSQFTASDSGVAITLFEPLFQTLLTETAQNLLKCLVFGKKIPQLRSEIKNQLHLNGITRIQRASKISWPLIDADYDEVDYKEVARNARNSAQKNLSGLYRKEDVAHAGRDEIANYVFQPVPHEVVRFDEDALGQKKRRRLFMASDAKSIENRSITQDALKNRKIFGMAVAAKAAANLEIKERFNQVVRIEPQDDEAESMPTLSDLLLQVQLGADYVMPQDIQSLSSRRKADLRNLKAYHGRYAEMEGELKREADPLETDFERIAEILEIERQHKKWYPMHHASKPEVKYLWVANTALRQLLAIHLFEKGTNPAMRATDIYFRGYNTIQESVEKTGTEDYEIGNANRRLSTNMAVTAGLRTTYTSSSSPEYFFNAHSVKAPSTMKRFEESAQLLGMVDISYLPYQSLYEQYFGCASRERSNSVWTILLVHPDILDTYSYPAHGGGRFFNPDFPQREIGFKKGMQSSGAVYQRARSDMLDKINGKGKEASGSSGGTVPNFSSRLVESIAEMRLLLHPCTLKISQPMVSCCR
jgi:8-oxo-dGTP pyrophosphatase MutT (NUDIX family)